MKYREHRGGLPESMATVVEVETLDELKEHLKKTWPELEDLYFSHAIFDERIGWDTYHVCVKMKGRKNYFVAEMSDGEFQINRTS